MKFTAINVVHSLKPLLFARITVETEHMRPNQLDLQNAIMIKKKNFYILNIYFM